MLPVRNCYIDGSEERREEFHITRYGVGKTRGKDNKITKGLWSVSL